MLKKHEIMSMGSGHHFITLEMLLLLELPFVPWGND